MHKLGLPKIPTRILLIELNPNKSKEYCHCEFEAFIRNRKLSKYLGASKWKNEVMVIKNTPNKNDWPRAILEKCQKK